MSDEEHIRPSGLDRGESKRQRTDGMPGGGEVERAETDDQIQELRREFEEKYRQKVVD